MRIEMKDLSYTYPDTASGALHGINLNIDQGEFVLLTGESGCGKSTVTRVINGLIPGFYGGKLDGQALISGKAIKSYSSYELAALVGSVFQNPRTQFFNVDTDSEIVFGLENAGESTAKINKAIEDVTNELKLKDLRGRDIFKLSGGEKQKIAFASVYATNPQIYLLDEPSANLDTAGIEDLKECLKRLKSMGKTVVIAEHRLYYLSELVDRVILMKDGMIEREIDGDTFRAMEAETLNEMGLRTNRLCCFDNNKTWPDIEKGHEGRLNLKNISVIRGKKRVLNNLNLEFEAGEIYCVMGHNGVGKSTLLGTICGLLKINEGKITWNANSISSKGLKKKSFLVMQDVNYQLFADSVLNECLLGTKGKHIEDASRTLKEMGLSKFVDRHPNTLSGGQKQRLAIAVSLLMDKEILLFDEPTSGLDYSSMLLCADFMKKLADKGKIVIIVTHDEEFTGYIPCEKVVLDNMQ